MMPKTLVTIARIERVLKAVQRVAPDRSVKVTTEGDIYIVPLQPDTDTGDVDQWFAANGESDVAGRS